MLFYDQKLLNIKEADSNTKNKLNNEVIPAIKQKMEEQGDFTALKIAFEKEDLKEIKDFANFINKNFKHTLVMGIGGSSLGAKTLLNLKHNTNITVLESIDSNTVEYVFDNLDLKNTAFLTVSKSGKTIECISQTLILLKKFEDKFGRDAIAKQFFFLTEDKDSPITQLAKEFGIKTLAHHNKIGGRFSYLSNTALIPACIAGLDIDAIRQGAVDTLEYFLNNKENFISEICCAQDNMFKNGIAENVVMPYVDRLYFLNEWYRQIWAESLGKGGFGTTPVNAMGTVDQHSQLQLYIDGPKNKFFTFILKDKEDNALKIEKTYNKGFDYLKGMSLDDIMKIESDATIEVLNKRNLPIRVLQIHKLNERTLSQILMQFMLETIVVGMLNSVNPFGQPAVEEKKLLAKTYYKN